MSSRIITISRLYGSGGREIGSRLAKWLDIPFYDKEIIDLAAKQSGVSGDFFAQPERVGNYILRDFSNYPHFELPLEDKVYIAQYTAIRALAQKGPCVIVGRGAGNALRDVVPLLNVFIYADMENRKRRAIEEYGDSSHKIEEHIEAIDKKRTAYFRFYADVDGRNMENYNLCIDSGFTDIEAAVMLIEAAYILQTKKLEKSILK